MKSCKDCEFIEKNVPFDKRGTNEFSYTCKGRDLKDNFKTCQHFKQRKRVVGYKGYWKNCLVGGLLFGQIGRAHV